MNTLAVFSARPPVKPATDCDRRILLHDRLQLRELLFHRREGDALVGDDLPDQDAGVLLREEGRRQQPDQEHVEHEQADQQQDDQQRMVQHGGRASASRHS